MRILIMGAGAIGGVMGARLTRAGEDVVLCRRSVEHVQAMRDRGLIVDGFFGEFTVPVRAATPDELEGQYDLVFLVVRTYQTAEALDQVIPHVAPEGLVVAVQNGLESKDLLVSSFGRERALASMVRLSAGQKGLGHVNQRDPGMFRPGELDGRMTPRLETVRQVMSKIAPTESTDNIFGWLWAKQVYSCLNNLTALVFAPKADVLSLPGAEEVALRAMREGAAVARAEGVRLEKFDFLDPNALLGNTPTDRARSRQYLADLKALAGRGETATARDLAKGLPTEAHDLGGEVVRRGRRVGVPTPIMDGVDRMIGEIERRERKQTPENIAELAAIQ